jgi:hypothetical protein
MSPSRMSSKALQLDGLPERDSQNLLMMSPSRSSSRAFGLAGALRKGRVASLENEPVEIRTRDLSIISRVLYQAKLRAQYRAEHRAPAQMRRPAISSKALEAGRHPEIPCGISDAPAGI